MSKKKKEPEKLEFDSAQAVIDHLEGHAKETDEAIKVYRSKLQEFTGHNPNQQLTPLDVVKIVLKVFPQLGAKA